MAAGPCAGELTTDEILRLISRCFQGFLHLSAPVGEAWDSALDIRLEGEWHLCLRRWAGGLTASCVSFRPVAAGVFFIPFVAWDPCISMSEELWLIHVTEPVTETNS